MKRPLSHRLFSVMLALQVLAASVGLTVLQHTCRQSGHRTTSVVFSTPQHRCPAPQPTAPTQHHAAKFKGACCDFHAHQHKLDAPSPELAWSKLLPTPFVADWLPAPAWPALVPPAPAVAAADAWHATDSSPPPRAGRALLAFIHVLVV